MIMKDKVIYALGFFDGVHLGHQALLTQCRRLAAEQACKTGAVTFDLPPAAVLSGQKPDMLVTTQDRVRLLRQYGMETVTVYNTDARTLGMPWRTFLEGLVEQGAAGFVCGNDFRFGCGGQGNVAVLQSFCKENNLSCVVVPEQMMDGERISSTRIRRLLEQGKVEQANRLLGHAHILSGPVVAGQQLGRTIGIPTANLCLPEELLTPKYGVYACKVFVEDREYIAVTNIGNRPTVGGDTVTVEAFLLDFEGDLYGKELALAFCAFLRQEQKFADLAQLQEEICKNARQARNFFEKSE